MNSDVGGSNLPQDGERYIPGMRGVIHYEHIQRYAFASALVKGKSVLDVACGEGYGSALLSEQAAEVVGVDCSTRCVASATNKYTNRNVRFLLGDLLAIPIGDSMFEVVVSFESIEHVSEPELAIVEMKRVLSPQGLMVVSTPDKRFYPPGNRFHLGELERAEFECLLRRNFRNVRLFGQRAVAGVLLAPVDGVHGDRDGVWSETGGELCWGGLQDPLYIIAVCSDGPIPDVSCGLIENPKGSEAVWRVFSHDFPIAEKKLKLWYGVRDSLIGRALVPVRALLYRWVVRR